MIPAMSITPQLLLAAVASLQSPVAAAPQDKTDQCIREVMAADRLSVTQGEKDTTIYTSSGAVNAEEGLDNTSVTATATVTQNKRGELTYSYSLNMTGTDWGGKSFGATATQLSETRITLDFNMADLGAELGDDDDLIAAQGMVGTLATQGVLEISRSVRACIAS